MDTRLTLYIAKNCPSCRKVENVLNEFDYHHESIELKIKDISEFRPKQVTIIPSLFVADKLFAIGEVDTNKLSEYIREKSKAAE